MTIQTVEDFLVHEISTIYSVEKQLTKALLKFSKVATDQTLAQAFLDHLVETKEHINRLEKVAEMCNVTIKEMQSAAMDGLIKDGNALVAEIDNERLRDVALVSTGHKIEHYEIAAYTHLMQVVKYIGNRKAHKLLSETLAEEESADERFYDMCVNHSKKSSRYKTE